MLRGEPDALGWDSAYNDQFGDMFTSVIPTSAYGYAVALHIRPKAHPSAADVFGPHDNFVSAKMYAPPCLPF